MISESSRLVDGAYPEIGHSGSRGRKKRGRALAGIAGITGAALVGIAALHSSHAAAKKNYAKSAVASSNAQLDVLKREIPAASQSLTPTVTLEAHSYELATMPLCATLNLHVAITSAAPKDTVVKFAAYYVQEDGSDGEPLWSSLSEYNGTTPNATIEMCRMRPKTTYVVRVYYTASTDWDGAASLLADGIQVTSGSTGFAVLDAGEYATKIHGDAGWSLLTTITEITGDGYGNATAVFDGMITLDAWGQVVWFMKMPYNSALDNSTGETGYAVWDRIPDSYDIVLMRDNNAFWELDPSYLAELYQITPLGETEVTYKNTCEGDASNFNQISHECRIDTQTEGYPVVTFAYSVRDDFGNATASGLTSADADVAKMWEETYGAPSDVRWCGMKVVQWDRTSNDPVELFDLFDILNPRDTPMDDNPNLTLMQMRCSGMSDYTDGVDYHHGSSINIGTANNYVLTSRNLDAVFSLGRDGAGLQWLLSPTLESNFTFVTDADKFYDPHDVTQLTNTTLTLIDDGNARPHCNFDDASHTGCFSRAIELELDFDTLEARVTWQYEFPSLLSNTGDLREAEKTDVFNEVGGSVTKLLSAANNVSAYEDFIVAFTAIDDTDDNATSVGYQTFVYQVNPDGDAVATMTLPVLPSWGTAGRYRVEPSLSLNGESADCPFPGGYSDDDA